eukprot:gnl/MRDRNA2_/MRDRNA2_86663_c0_seq1.p2 gnl/MRDRNA2_/MRDRNA2_86663_c0~~gnl/MRDRNA2_/MRDRNA2_86663_c0_seq1.p2  ORF type:complete len:166 (+),score=8.87 gnl/MRDRNA2_/MRDRNA2_86663_c0_seq1:3033-3530(+)
MAYVFSHQSIVSLRSAQREQAVVFTRAALKPDKTLSGWWCCMVHESHNLFFTQHIHRSSDWRQSALWNQLPASFRLCTNFIKHCLCYPEMLTPANHSAHVTSGSIRIVILIRAHCFDSFVSCQPRCSVICKITISCNWEHDCFLEVYVPRRNPIKDDTKQSSGKD